MRIVCPNCASQYEVAEDAIPEAGRDVQCAKCAEIWFQDRPMKLTMEEAPLPLEPSIAPEPEAPAIETPDQTPPPAEPTQAAETAEVSAVFRSLRADRAPTAEPSPAPTPVVEPAPEPAPIAEVPRQRQPISPEVQSILQEEANFAASQLNKPTEAVVETPTEVVTQAQPEEVAHQPELEELARKMRALEEERDQLVRKQAETDPRESVTLASAKSLRDILESEAIDPIDITDAGCTPVASEPSLEKLGLRRPTPIIRPDEDVTTITPVRIVETDGTQPTKDTTAKSDVPEIKMGKAIFADIDELSPSIEEDGDDAADSSEDDLINFNDEDIKETASKFSIGFLAAFVLAIFATTMYMFAPKIAGSVPAVSGFMTAYHTTIDDQRMVLQDMYYQGGEPGFDTLLKNAKDKYLP